MRTLLQTLSNTLLSADADQVCGAEWGQPSADRLAQRNGYHHRSLPWASTDCRSPRFPGWPPGSTSTSTSSDTAQAGGPRPDGPPVVGPVLDGGQLGRRLLGGLRRGRGSAVCAMLVGLAAASLLVTQDLGLPPMVVLPTFALVVPVLAVASITWALSHPARW